MIKMRRSPGGKSCYSQCRAAAVVLAAQVRRPQCPKSPRLQPQRRQLPRSNRNEKESGRGALRAHEAVLQRQQEMQTAQTRASKGMDRNVPIEFDGLSIYNTLTVRDFFLSRRRTVQCAT